jgi:hypothetical protein
MFDKHAVGESNFLFNKFPQVVTRECFYRASSQLLYDAVTAGNALLNTSGSEECRMRHAAIDAGCYAHRILRDSTSIHPAAAGWHDNSS